MASLALAISKAKKAVIHVARAQLGMVDADYRALLKRAGGVESSAALDDAGFTVVMAEFECLGFRNTKGRAQTGKREDMATPAQIGRIYALWKAYSGADDEQRLNHWLETHFHVSHVRFLKCQSAGKAVAILEGMVKKARKKARADDKEQKPNGKI